MTNPTTPKSESDKARPQAVARKSRPVVKLFAALLAILLIFIVFGAWLITSESGARLTLSMVGRAANVQFQGVSGSLNHQLHIQHLVMLDKKMELGVDGIDVQWQPAGLFKHQLMLDHVRIDSVELALAAGDGQPAKLPATLRLPEIIKLLTVGQLEVHQFQLSDLDANHQHTHALQFSKLLAAVSVDSSAYTVNASGATPWGSALLKGSLATATPFNLQAQVSWTGLAISEDGVTLPETVATGTVSGNLSKIAIQAQIDSTEPEAPQPPTQKAKFMAHPKGHVQVVLTPFSILPVDTMQLAFSGLNPASFYQDAPVADLQLDADLRLTGDTKSPELSGHFSAHNDRPATWNAGGVPVIGLSSDLNVSEHKINWKNTLIELEQNGRATGAGEFAFANAASSGTQAKDATPLPQLIAQLELKNVNLLRIDSRLKTTQLNGNIQVQNKNQALIFGLHLHESDPKLSAQLNADLSLNNQYLLKLQQVELIAKDATLSGAGFIALRGNQTFSLTGEAHNFNPARWIDVPDGHIATHFQFTGKIQKGWQVDAQLSELSGQFAGLDLHGESDFHAQQDQLLAIKKLELNWGKNHLSANGNWQLGKHPDLTRHDQLQFSLAVPDLAALSHPFEKMLAISFQGSLFADGVLSGSVAQPGGHLSIKSDHLAIPNLIYLDSAQADVALDEGTEGKIDGNVILTNIAARPVVANQDDQFRIERLQARLSGVRHAHTLDVNASLPQNQQLNLRASGDLQDANPTSGAAMQWAATMSLLNLSGPVDFQLQSPFHLLLSSQAAQMGEASWNGKLGRLHVQQLDWQPGQLKSSGQFQSIPVLKVLRLWRNDLPLSGQLMLDATWQFDIGQQVAGQMQIQRTGGDLILQDTSGGILQPIALGLQKLVLKANVGDDSQSGTQSGAQSGVAAFSHQQIHSSLQAQGEHLGLINVDLTSSLTKTDQGWTLAHDAPLSGQASLQIKDMSWMSQLLGSGISLRGVLDANGTLGGVLNAPEYQAKIAGQDLQIAYTELGILLPNGKLDASIDGSQLTLNSLKFSQTIKTPPKHEFLLNLPWLNQTGYVESTGSVDLHTMRGSINTTWDKFPFLQNPEGWMVASGQAQLAESEHTWNLTGKLIADAAYFSVPKQAAPKLSSDVVVLKKNAKRNGEKSTGLQTNLDFSVSTGNNFIFVGRGIDTRLDGDIRIRSKNGGTILATGSIQTMGGNYEGYGQQLAIDRGILNFQGAIDNPGLNVRAVRHGLPVEAGVEVLGTVDKPEVRLISEPDVPDPDKLSWLVLGRPSDQMAGSETALLVSAAGAIFGSDDGGSIPSSIAHTLGLGDLSFGTSSTTPDSQMPTQTVAGTVSSTAPADQVFSVGKRIAPDIVFSIERSLTDASNGLKLTWQLTRRFSIIGRAGSDTAIDGQYTFSFD